MREDEGRTDTGSVRQCGNCRYWRPAQWTNKIMERRARAGGVLNGNCGNSKADEHKTGQAHVCDHWTGKGR